MPGPVPLSVVIITKNEASRLADCLDSVRWAGEIVVVDDESTDATVEIARRATDRVISRKMEIEGRHRNFAYAQAKYDWVLSLDADERVTPELREEIVRLLQGKPQFRGYTMPRRNYIGPWWVRHGGWYPSPQLRLFRKDSFRYEEVEVHPRAFMEGPTGALAHDFIHYSYRDLADFLGKLNRQTTLEARKWTKDGRRMTVTVGLWRTVDRCFYRTLWLNKGYRDGLLGYLIAAYAGLYQFLSYAKYWQLSKNIIARRPEGPIPRPSLRGHEVPEAISMAGSGQAAQSSPSEIASLPLVARNDYSRQKLTAVILTKNAAATLRPCLESVRWVDEVIVVDGGSTDGTCEMVRAEGAHLVTNTTSDDFAHLRNVGTDRAQGDRVLQLDAAEVVTPEFRRSLERLLREPTSHAAYKFRRYNFFLGRRMRFGGWEHDSLHLFRKGLAHYEGRVHERLLVQGSIGRLEEGVNHFPFRSLEEFVDRQNRYTSLEARELFEKQPDPPESELRYQIQVKSAKLFWKLYVRKQGFREGMHGLIFCSLYAFVHLIKWGKYWELVQLSKENLCAS